MPMHASVVVLLSQFQNVDPIIFASAEPVFVGLTHPRSEFLVQRLTGSGPSVPIDAFEIAGNPANEGGLQDSSVTLVLIFPEDGVRIAVNRLGIARKSGHFFLSAPRHSVSLAH